MPANWINSTEYTTRDEMKGILISTCSMTWQNRCHISIFWYIAYHIFSHHCGPKLKQHWVNVSCLLCNQQTGGTEPWHKANAGLMLGQCHIRWANINPALVHWTNAGLMLAQRLVCCVADSVRNAAFVQWISVVFSYTTHRFACGIC